MRLDRLVKTVDNLDLYSRKMLKLNLSKMPKLQRNKIKCVTIDVDANYSDESSDDVFACKHDECHEINCFERDRLNETVSSKRYK